MVLLLLVEVCNTLDGQIVGLCCARGEDDLLGISAYKRCHLDIRPTDQMIKYTMPCSVTETKAGAFEE